MTVSHCLAVGAAALAGAFFASAVHAQGMNIGQRGPSSPDPSSLETVARADQSISLNPGLDPVVSSDGWTSRTRAEVDAATGVVRGYAGLSHGALDGDLEFPSAIASGSISALGVLSTAAPGRVPVTISFGFDGRPLLDDGTPTHQLLATLVAGVPSSFASYTSQITFASYRDRVPIVLTRAQRSQAGLPGPVDDAAATPIVTGQGADLWSGTLQVKLEVADGEAIQLLASLQGMVLGGYDGEAYVPTSAAMDFLNSGQVRVAVPAGVGISGASPLWSQAVVVVPEPATWALWLGGLAGLAALRWRKSS